MDRPAKATAPKREAHDNRATKTAPERALVQKLFTLVLVFDTLVSRFGLLRMHE